MKGIRLKDEMINIKQILEAADIAFIYEEENCRKISHCLMKTY